MSPISIVFSTSNKPRFRWFDDLDALTDEELNEIIIHSRSATAAFSAELSDRCKPWRDEKSIRYYNMLWTTVDQINQTGFTYQHETRIQGSYSLLADSETGETARSETKLARQFLWLISRVTCWAHALLILCALGRHAIQKMDDDQRAKLIQFIAQNHKPLFCRKLQEKAIQHNLHQIEVKVKLPLTRGCRKRKRDDSQDSAAGRKKVPPINQRGNVRSKDSSIHSMLNDKTISSNAPNHAWREESSRRGTEDQGKEDLMRLQYESKDAATASGVCKTASKFSDVVSDTLAAVPQYKARQIGNRINKTSDSDQRTSKRRRTCLDNGIVTPPPIPPTSDATHHTSEEKRYYPLEQSQQFSASSVPSLQHLLIPTSCPHSLGYNISYSGCDGTNTNSRSGIAVDSTAHQGFSAHGSTLSQSLQYYGQYRAPSKDAPILQTDNFRGEAPGPRLEDGFTTGSASYFSNYPEVGGAECTTGSVNYFPTYPEAGGAVTGAASGSHLDIECTIGSVNYLPTYPEAGGVFTGEAPDICSDSGAATGTIDYFPTYPEAGGVFTGEAPDIAVCYIRHSNPS